MHLPPRSIGLIGQPAQSKATLSAAIYSYAIANNLIDAADKVTAELILESTNHGHLVFDFTKDGNNFHLIDNRNAADEVSDMVSEATRLDAAVLVADVRRPVAETFQYIEKARAFGIPSIIVFLNHVSPKFPIESLNLYSQQIRQVLNQLYYPGDETPIIYGNTEQGADHSLSVELSHSIELLIEQFDKFVAVADRPENQPFLMPIEDVFTISGRGTVARGRVERGILLTRLALDIIGVDSPRKVRKADRKTLATRAGEYAEFDLEESDVAGVSVGQVISAKDSLEETQTIETTLTMLAADEGGVAHAIEEAQIHIAGQVFTGRFSDPIMSTGEMGKAYATDIILDRSTFIPPGSRFAVRLEGRTIAAGAVEMTTEQPTVENEARQADQQAEFRGIDFAVGRSTDQQVGFFYATTRRHSSDEKHLKFSGERAEELSYGRAVVRVPEERKDGKARDYGTLNLPFSLKLWKLSLYKQKANPKKHFIIKSAELLSSEEWQQQIRASELKKALVFVHGFNNSFEDAVYRAGQVFWDLRYDGVPILFSWASRARIRSYEYDQQSAMLARDHFIEMLKNVRNQGVEEIHILAHSMGNYLVTEALQCHNYHDDPLPIGELIFAAADVDSDNFKKSVEKLAMAKYKMTLYASSKDKALLASMKLADAVLRAGYVVGGQPLVLPHMDTIDGSALGDQLLGLNHGDFAEKNSILNDLGLLIDQHIRPPSRRLKQFADMPVGAVGEMVKWWRFQ